MHCNINPQYGMNKLDKIDRQHKYHLRRNDRSMLETWSILFWSKEQFLINMIVFIFY